MRLRVDSAAMLIGSPNRLVITGPAGMSAVDFSALDTIKALQRLGEVTDSLKGDERQIALPFSVYDSVGLLIPNLPVVVGDERVFTNDVALVVSFAAVDTSIVRLRGIYAEPSRLSDYASWFAVGLGLLVLGLVAWWLWRARHPTQVLAAAAPPPLPPHEIALRRLAELRGSSLADAPWYAALDHVLRSYLEARYGIPALERTSREVAELLTQERLPAEDLSTLLERVDLIKFAKAAAGPAQRAEHLDQVERFVRATVPPVVTLADPSSPTDRPT